MEPKLPGERGATSRARRFPRICVSVPGCVDSMGSVDTGQTC